MTTVYLDESGDLGFDLDKGATSRFFIVAALLCPDPKPVEKAVRKVFAGFTKTQIRARHGVLHAVKEDRRTNERLLRLLAELPVSVIAIRMDKTRVYTGTPDEKHLLYNYIVNILLERLVTLHLVTADEAVHVVAAQRETSAFLNDNFAGYLLSRHASPHWRALTVAITPTSAAKGLQVADCLAWSFYQKYEHGDASYVELIASRIVEESSIYG